jgi:divalent metal cation (Fe/Co/Zn/Cd) transporter
VNGERITRADLEAKLRDIESVVDETKEAARTAGMAIALGAVVLVLIVFLLGRRKGKKTGGARVEVYRIR